MSQLQTSQDQAEMRRLDRHEITHQVSIFDTFSGETLGNLVNVSTEGLMIVSQQPIDNNRIYQVTLSLPQDILDGAQLELVIDCLWSKQAGSQSAYWSGFYIVDADEFAAKAFEILIAKADA